MKYKYMTSIFTSIFVIFIGVISIVTPDKEISDLEGRPLQKLPTPNSMIDESFNRNAYIYELLTGTMFEKWDKYFSDHIYSRDSIVNIYTSMQGDLDKKYINGVYLGQEEYLFSPTHVKEVSTDELKDRANYFNKFANRFNHKKVYMVNLPNKNMAYEENMPIDGYKAPENSYIDEMMSYIDTDKINIIDFRDAINNKENLYYKTDHHWNMDGTYSAYQYIINKINKEFEAVGKPKERTYFEIETYDNYFVGTDGRKVGQLVDKGEDIKIFTNDDDDKYEVKMQGDEWNLYHKDQLEESKFNNDYGVYLGGDNPKLTITNKKAKNNLSIVVIGDSMDNPLIPLISEHYSTVYSYDLRSYSGDIISDIDEINPDMIMLIGLTGGILKETSDGDVFKWNL